MPISRRQFLIGGASALALAACSGDDDDKDVAPASTSTTTTTPVTVPTTEAPAAPLAAPPFTLGVASGDPDTSSVVLWTRLLRAEGDHPVVWEVSADDGFERLVVAGTATAIEDDAHSVHVVAGGLEPDTWYWYRFTAGEHTSPVGRTRTTPKGDTDSLCFAFASCQSYDDGYYTAHQNLAIEEKLDLVVWLGDYIYEGGINPSAIRPHDAPEVLDLDDYRGRYALYKSDPNLQAAHARAPWLVIWDDHEVDNNYAGDTPELDAPKVDFAARRTAAYRAWWEHQPTRLPKPTGSPYEVHRKLQWGQLAAFFALDGRQYRDDQPCGRGSDLGAGCAERDDPARTMLGAEQEAWLAEELTASAATWNVLAQQTIFSPSGIPLGDSEIFNLDQWDGYPAARDRLLEVLNVTANPVVITGDIHASAVADFKLGEEIVGSELVGTSVTSQFPEVLIDIFEAAAESSGAKMADARSRGYVLCEVTTDELTAHYRVVESIKTETSPVTTSSSWVIAAGTPGIRPLA